MADLHNHRFSASGITGSEPCNGCAVCTLSCPVWRETHDLMMTFCGRMRSVQSGAAPADLRASVDACVLCGSCEPVCSFGMNTVERTLALRREAFGAGAAQSRRPTAADPASSRTGTRPLLLNPLLRERPDRGGNIAALLGRDVRVASDSGEDIAEALESGRRLPSGRIPEFIRSIDGARRIVTTDGLLYRLLVSNVRGARVMGLGEALLTRTDLASLLGPDDLYVIDARTYHADFARLVALYDGLRRRTGCMTNLDLHRVATPTGATRAGRGIVDPVRQARWILEGRPARRIVVEAIEDMAPFAEASNVPVLFVADAADGGS